MAEKRCPECGMPETKWPHSDGFAKGRELYCCSGCAEKTGCVCPEGKNWAKNNPSLEGLREAARAE